MRRIGSGVLGSPLTVTSVMFLSIVNLKKEKRDIYVVAAVDVLVFKYGSYQRMSVSYCHSG